MTSLPGIKAFSCLCLLVAGLMFAGGASAVTATKQVLDTIAVFGPGTAGSVVPIDNTQATDDFEFKTFEAFASQGASGLRACKLTSNRGLFCIDGQKNVKNWANPTSGEPGVTLFNCSQLNELDSKSSETCTGITVDPQGHVWIAGKNKGRTHSLLKVKDESIGTCPSGSSQGGIPGLDSKGEATTYCSITWATGRPLLVDIEMITGEAADALKLAGHPLGEGIIGVQERKTVVFFPVGTDRTSPLPDSEIADLGSGKTGWGLSGNEQLQGATLLQLQQTDRVDNFILATTSLGRVISKDLGTGLVESGFWSAGTLCNRRDPQQFGVRASSKSGLVYVTDRQCGALSILEPTSDGKSGSLAYPTVTVSISPEGPTIAAGIGVNLLSRECKSDSGCEVAPGATLFSSGGDIANGSGLTLFQIKDIPDCRWIPTAEACQGKNVIARLDTSCAGARTNGCISDNLRLGKVDPIPDNPTQAHLDQQEILASQEYLNVTELLPKEVTDLLSDTLPPILISPYYRARDEIPGQTRQGHYFEAFFGIPEDGAVFTGNFVGDYEVGASGRDPHLIDNRTDTSCAALPGNTPPDKVLAELLDWDVVTYASDDPLYPGAGFVNADTIINTGCNSVVSTKKGWSLVPYGLETNPNIGPTDAEPVIGNDAVFARLLERLYGEFDFVLSNYACNPGRSQEHPLAPGDCDAMKASLAFAREKLDRCLDAAYQPKQSASNQNCQSFESQFSNFEQVLSQTTSQCPNDPASCDPANRLGELTMRAKVIRHLYEFRFLPSIPVGGFCKELGCPTTP